MSKIAKRIVALSCVVVLLSTMMVVPASASPSVSASLHNNHMYTILPSLDSRWALDVYANDFTPGTNADLWYSNWDDAQTFTITKVYDDWYVITHTASGNVLDVEGGDASSGANVLLWPYHSENNDNQLWTFIKDGGGYRIKSKLGTYLTVNGKVKNLQNVCASNGITNTENNRKNPDVQLWYLYELTPEDIATDYKCCDMDIRLWNAQYGMPMYYETMDKPLTMKSGTRTVNLEFRGTKLQVITATSYKIDFRGHRIKDDGFIATPGGELETRKGSLDGYGVYTCSMTIEADQFTRGNLYEICFNMKQESGEAEINHCYVKVT